MAKNKYGGICNISNPDKRVYNLWYGMLRRCYDKKQLKRNRGKCYTNCSVCERWLDYSNFASDIPLLSGYEYWLNSKEFCLDKDTILPNNRVYSIETCCFVSKADNVRDIHRRKPQNIKRLHELNKTKYMLTKGEEVLYFNSETEACKYLGVARCSVSSCYRRACKCKGYTITRMDGGEE